MPKQRVGDDVDWNDARVDSAVRAAWRVILKELREKRATEEAAREQRAS